MSAIGKIINQSFSKYFNIFLSLALFCSIFSVLHVNSQTIPAPAEPNCQTVSTNPAFNPYPITTRLSAPDIISGDCKDMPLISFFPIDFRNNNPREKTIVQGQDVSFQLYYINGARPDGSGNPKIENPVVKMELIKESNTKYRVRAVLSGNNVTTTTSADKGGDLIINTPANTTFKIMGRDTRHYNDAIERKYQVETGQNSQLYDFIQDNSNGNTISNPIWSRFEGVNLPSTSGFQIKPNLEAGLLGYGYILTSITAEAPAPQPPTPPVTPENLPPSLPGEEITVVRGQNGSFQRLNGTDQDNNYPLTYDLSQLPANCRQTSTGTGSNGPGRTGPVITCSTDANTPTRFQFIITPIDSKGLRGTPGTFIVNVIEPKMTSIKQCFVKGTNNPCASTTLKPGDDVTYKVTVNSTGTYKLTNLRITDTYDKTRLNTITNISDNGTLGDGTINWSLGDLAIGASKSVTFDAKISNNVQNGDIVLNRAVIKADNLPDQNVSVQFPIAIGNIIAVKECFVKGTNTPCASAELKPGNEVTYKITVKNTTQTTVKNLRITDTYDKTRLNTITNISDNGTLGDGTINWSLGDLAGNATKTVNFNAKITDAAKSGDVIVNIAKIVAEGIPEITVQVQFPVVTDEPLLSTSNKECFRQSTNTACNQANLKPGDKVTYKINVKNTGKGIAKNLRITDTYDKTRLNGITNLNPQGQVNTDQGTITWSIGDLTAGQTSTLVFDATITNAIANGDIIINSAVIKADNLPDQNVSVQFAVTLPGMPPIVTPPTPNLPNTPANPTLPQNLTPNPVAPCS